MTDINLKSGHKKKKNYWNNYKNISLNLSVKKIRTLLKTIGVFCLKFAYS